MTLADRLRSHVTVDLATGCWLWTGAVARNGYGQVGIDKRTRSAHRVSYETFVGPIPRGLQLDHLCRVRRCINPAHLEPVTRDENQARSPITTAGRTHCQKGHPLTGDNLVIKKRGSLPPVRNCRTCRDAYQRAWKARRAAA